MRRLVAAYEGASIYFPFTDVIVSDPYQDMSGDLTTAFYIGQSEVVEGIKTDMVAFATKDVFAQIWVGTRGQAATPAVRRVSSTIPHGCVTCSSSPIGN